MEAVKALPFLVFFSYSKCESLQTSLLHAARQRVNGQDHLEENLGLSVSVMVTQFLQDAAYDEVQTVAQELLDLAERCKHLKPRKSPSECAHHLMASFLTHICNNHGLVDRHVFTDCCKMKNAARLSCFLSYKKDDADSHDTSLFPRPELTCEVAKEKNVSLKARFSYETSRRHPFLFGPTILTTSACYETAVQSCCQEENKTECLQTKLEPIRKYIRGISARHHHLCEIGTKFNEKVSSAVELILLTKKQPKAKFSEIAKLTVDVKNLHEICCEGNTLACALGRRQLMNYTCSHQAVLSSKFAECCELPEPFRGECIITSENDDNPDLSPLLLTRFTEDQSVCEQFSGNQDDFLQEFLYEYSRRHPELAVPVILRVFETYKRVLENCCKLENPLECLQLGKEVFHKVVLESRDHVKAYCDLHKQLGGKFQDRLTVLYTKKIPQLSAQELVVFAKKMAAAASRCCPLRDELQPACVEDQAKLILGALCRSHGRTPVSAGVGRCCDDSYAFRKPCFDDLQENGTYISSPLSCDRAISLKEDLCPAQDVELQIEKQKLLSNLAKQKPHAAEDLFHSLGEDFLHVVEKCCHAQRREVCFQEEGPRLTTRCQSLLEAASPQSGLV
ncbi:alpha-fetoprotein-like [Apodemus sylvaticus]|uniref:alpha-fetoprotein-like n=1 Tax=Apodemus sylvaticus TaxID=10129 RepID=UPI0022420338|nr:alpha-fetoprotein-like [Apodemus sylvaticus]